jgi:hypothetical protein
MREDLNMAVPEIPPMVAALIRDAVESASPLNACEQKGVALALGAILSAEERSAEDLVAEWNSDEERDALEYRRSAIRYLNYESVFRVDIHVGLPPRRKVWFVEAADALDAAAAARVRAKQEKAQFVNIRRATAEEDLDALLADDSELMG